MNVNNFYQTMYLNRITAMALLVRLENADIPYPHSKLCREQLVYYLSSILLNENRDEKILKIEYEELDTFVDDIDSAIKIINLYSIRY